LPQRLAKAALAFWVLAASTCGAVAHAHSGGDRPHSHHFGLVSLKTLAPRSNPVRFAGLHRHLVVFGVESGNLPADQSGEDGSPPTPANGPDVAVGFGTIKLDVDSPTDPVQLTLPDAGIELVTIVEPVPPLPSRIDPVPTSPAACAKALRARSGVQLV
jgi:hypothetical protein